MVDLFGVEDFVSTYNIDIEEYNRNVVLLPQIVGENVFSKLV